MTAQLCAALFGSLAWMTSAAVAANDCDYNREQFQTYQANCAQMDGCGYLEQMKTIVAESCGSTARPVPSKPAPAVPSARAPASANGGARPTTPAASHPAPAQPAKQDWGAPLSKDMDHSGKPCNFFNGRPAIESDGFTTRHNTYANGVNVCHGQWLYVCETGRWKTYSYCPANGKQSEEFETGLL